MQIKVGDMIKMHPDGPCDCPMCDAFKMEFRKVVSITPEMDELVVEGFESEFPLSWDWILKPTKINLENK